MTTVADILRAKNNSTMHSVAPNDTMLVALQRMSDYGIGALLVMEGERIAGIVTERDYARKVVLQGRSSSSTAVREVMTVQVHCVLPRQTTAECMALMTDKRIRHLPVVNDKHQVLGMVSIGDLVKEIISEQQFTIQQLEHYITGTHG
ncbi:MAG: CBS domain-containing protein [Acidovorax sp.]|jgi:CBS domain-containing protein|nr:CBS domain-containing protein [Acidovorax sp.]